MDKITSLKLWNSLKKLPLNQNTRKVFLMFFHNLLKDFHNSSFLRKATELCWENSLLLLSSKWVMKSRNLWQNASLYLLRKCMKKNTLKTWFTLTLIKWKNLMKKNNNILTCCIWWEISFTHLLIELLAVLSIRLCNLLYPNLKSKLSPTMLIK